MNIFKIYHIEDDDDHAELVNYHISNIENSEILYRSIDGEDAISTVNKIANKELESPNLILLDINIPKFNGIEVLKRIRSIEEISSIPVVAFTTSNSKKDKELAYKHHINSYITKPADFEKMVYSLNEMVKYWRNLNCV